MTEGTAIYRASAEEREDGLTPHALIRGQTRANEELVDAGDEVLLSLREVDINGDGVSDYYGTPGEDPWCSDYDGCVGGVYAGCDEGLAELWAPSAPSARATGTSATVDGFRWYDLMTTERGASWTDEIEEEDEGRAGGSATLYRMGADHRYHAWAEATGEMVETCRRHMSADELEAARPFCRNAESLVEQRSERGEMTFALGRIAERLGEIAAARELYERAREDRPDDAAIEGRLSALPESE